MRLYIVRHGDPDYEHDTLTPEGHLEAQAVAERFAATGLDRIFSSPMGRAIATMRYTAEKLGLDYDIEDWTHEINELWMNESPWGPMAAWDIPGELLLGEKPREQGGKYDWCEEFRKIGIDDYLQKMHASSDAFLKRLGYERCGNWYRAVRPNEEKVAVFCHGGFGLTWIAYLLNIPLEMVWAGFWLPPTSVTTILFDSRYEGRATPRCIGLADVSHLYKAGLEVLPRGIIANFY